MSSTARDRQHGQALALFTLALTAIILAAAVVVDGGFAFSERRRAQNAADFAAIAGTRIVGIAKTGEPAGAGTAANVRGAVNSTLAANDAALVSARYVDEAGEVVGDVSSATTIPQDAFGVVVEARTDWKPFLLGFIGIADWTASAPATAYTTGTSNDGGVMPVALSDDAYGGLISCEVTDFDDCIDNLTPGTNINKGSFGWLSFGRKTNNPHQCPWENSLGMRDDDDDCDQSNGFLNRQIGPPAQNHGCCGPIGQEGSADRIGTFTSNTHGDFSFYIENQMVVWVPIYDAAVGPQGSGSGGYYDIIGFGPLVLTEQDGNSNSSAHVKWLKGKAVTTDCVVEIDGVEVDYSIEGVPYCKAPLGNFTLGATGEVQLRR